MSPDRRQFLWMMGSAAGALSLVRLGEIVWTPQEAEIGPGWAPGIEELTNSACLLCPGRCGIRGRTVDGNLVRIMGSRIHPMSRGGLCPNGVAGVQMLYHQDRLVSPLARQGERGAGDWRPLSLDEAVDEVAARLSALRQEGRPEAVAALTGYCAGSMADVWRRFLDAFGSPNCVPAGHENGMDAVMEVMHGVRRFPSYDLEGADTVLSFGAPLFESWRSPLQAFVAFAGSNAPAGGRRSRFIQVDHRFSHTAAHADEWVGVRPGTHWILALGMAYVILRDRLHDERFLAQHASGFEDFEDPRGRAREGFRTVVMRGYRTEEVSSLTGVSVERITELARSFATSPRSVAVCGQDVTLAPGGLLAGMAVHSLNVLVGSVGRSGGVLLGDEAPLTPLAPLVEDEVGRAGRTRVPIGGSGPAFGIGDQAERFARAVASGADAPPEVLLIYGIDPLGSSRISDVWREALGRIPLVVSFSPFIDETAQQADMVVPDLLPWERWQDAPTPPSYPYSVWGLARPLVSPAEGGMQAGDVLLALAQKLGGVVAGSLPYDSFEDLLKSRARGLFEARRGGTFASEFEMENRRQSELRGWWLPSQPDFESFWSELVDRGGWADLFYDETDPSRFSRLPDGRVALMPPAVLGALESEGGDRYPYVRHSDEPTGNGEEFPLLLLPYRVSTCASETLGRERWLAEQPVVFPDVQWVPWVSVAPGTAEETGLTEGHMVWVVSSRGRYKACLQVSAGIAPGTVTAPIGLRHPDGESADPLRLLETSAARLTGMPGWFTTHVRLEMV